jgi:hypothetical protein
MAVHANYAKQALMRHGAAPARPSPLASKPQKQFSLDYLLMVTALVAAAKSKATQSFTLQNVTLALSLALPWIFGVAGIVYMLVAVYVRSTLLTHEEERERWREAALLTAARGKLDTPRGASPRPFELAAAPSPDSPRSPKPAGHTRTLSDVVRNPTEAAPLDPLMHKRNLALLSEWRAERRENVAGRPAGHTRAQSWPPVNLDELRKVPPISRAPSAPPHSTPASP